MRSSWRRSVGLAVLLGAAAAAAQTPPIEVSLLDLPEAPGFAAAGQSSQTGTAVISGTVLDLRGDPVAGARVTISGAGLRDRMMETRDDGRFEFSGLGADKVTITITANGLETFVSNEIRLAAGEKFVQPNIALPVAPENASVNVTVTEDELATAEVNQQAKQRVLGVLPNFYTSYLWDAAPMRRKQKFNLMVKSALDPEVFVVSGIRAGVQQYRGSYPGYGDGFGGYAARYGAAYGDSVTGRIIGRALLPIIFHQDPRYFYLGSGSSVGKRMVWALSDAIICRGDNGKRQPNYSHVIGNFASAALRNLYLPPQNRKGGEVLVTGVELIGLNAVGDLVREFLPKKATTNVPDYKRGKPSERQDE